MLNTMTTHHNQAAPPPLDTGSADDWRRAASAQHSMLVEGPEASIQAVLQLLTPYLREPVTWLQRGISQTLPAEGSGTLVVQNIAALDRDGSGAAAGVARRRRAPAPGGVHIGVPSVSLG